MKGLGSGVDVLCHHVYERRCVSRHLVEELGLEHRVLLGKHGGS